MGIVSGRESERAGGHEARLGEVHSGIRLKRFLASGNLGPVYEGERLSDGTLVALKILSDPGIQRGDVAARLRLECELLRRLAHPNLVDVLEVGTTPLGEPYLVMEQLTGETLADRLLRGPLAATEALKIAARVASALSAAHRQGIVHSALRPRDIFLCREDGEPDVVKVLGFGLGKLSSEHSRITVRMDSGATGAYFAPEQLRAHARADHRTDQFALAAITYEMLTGQSPFVADNPAEVAQRILSREPAPPSRVGPDVPDAVDAVVLRALHKDPMARYANVSQLGQALENAAAAASIQARRRRSTPEASYRVRPEGEPASSGVREREADARFVRARELARLARDAQLSGNLDDAVLRAEELFEHVLGHQDDVRVLEVFRMHLPVLDRVFTLRLGNLEQLVTVGPEAEGPGAPALSAMAAALIDAARSGPTLGALLERAKMPRRDATRIIAGLLRRRLLETLEAPSSG